MSEETPQQQEPEKKPEPLHEQKPVHEQKPKAEAKPSSAAHLKTTLKGKLAALRQFWLECKRVLRVTKKPDKQEFLTIVKISSIGMGIIGLIGFITFFLKEILIG